MNLKLVGFILKLTKSYKVGNIKISNLSIKVKIFLMNTVR